MVESIPKPITIEENERLTRFPDDEVKMAVFQLDGTTAAGPDVFTRMSFHECWDIVSEDVVNMVKAFLCGQCLPRYISHTNLVLLPKKEIVRTFSDLSPVSLSYFINKVISTVIRDRIVEVLPELIYLNQPGFVKRRSILENVLLA